LITGLKNDWNLANVTILPSITQAEFKRVLAEVDVGLFSLAKHHTAHNFPGKLLGYMVESLPILGSVNPENDLQKIINQANAGSVFINGEDKKLLFEAQKLFADVNLRNIQGKAAFDLLQKEFSVSTATQNILSILSRS
jgi:hypothetical protein